MNGEKNNNSRVISLKNVSKNVSLRPNFQINCQWRYYDINQLVLATIVLSSDRIETAASNQIKIGYINLLNHQFFEVYSKNDGQEMTIIASTKKVETELSDSPRFNNSTSIGHVEFIEMDVLNFIFFLQNTGNAKIKLAKPLVWMENNTTKIKNPFSWRVSSKTKKSYEVSQNVFWWWFLSLSLIIQFSEKFCWQTKH